MNEAESIAALTNIGEAFSAFTGLWVSVTFAYLTVSYLVGKALSRFQTIAISTIYFVSALVFGASAHGYGHSWVLLNEREQTILKEAYVFADAGFFTSSIAVFLLGGTALSLYFMYDIRKRRSQDAT